MTHTTTAARNAVDLAVNTAHDVLVDAQNHAQAARAAVELATEVATAAAEALALAEDEFSALIAAQNALNGLGALAADDLALFLAYAGDAGNWGGTPLVGGNVGSDDPASVEQLEAEGLIAVDEDREPINGKPSVCHWVRFTEAGVALAASYGRTVEANA